MSILSNTILYPELSDKQSSVRNGAVSVLLCDDGSPLVSGTDLSGSESVSLLLKSSLFSREDKDSTSSHSSLKVDISGGDGGGGGSSGVSSLGGDCSSVPINV